MKFIRIAFFLISLSALCVSCQKNVDLSNAPRFDEEFFNKETILDYVKFEAITFGNSVFDPITGNDEEEHNRSFFYNSTSLFYYEDINQSCKTLKFQYRDYYSAFYSNELVDNQDIKKKEYSYCGRYALSDYSKQDEPYSKFVKFNNYKKLKDVKLIYDGFYLYNVIHLIDVFDGETKVATTFDFEYFAVFDNNLFFYDLPDYYTGAYSVYNESNYFFTYCDYNLVNKKTIMPYFYQPYEHSCLMGSRVETDGEYYYFGKLNEKQISSLSTNENEIVREIHLEEIKIASIINDYDIELHKNVKKEVENIIYRVPVGDLQSC